MVVRFGGGWLRPFSDGDVAEIRCFGPGAWHPVEPSWVPLPVPGAGVTYWGHGVRAWHPLTPSWGPSSGVPAPQIVGKSGGGSACAP